jgi:hypothetical protein
MARDLEQARVGALEEHRHHVASDLATIFAVKDRQPGSIGCPKGFSAVDTVPPGNTPMAPPCAR